jgi:transcriptional regulator
MQEISMYIPKAFKEDRVEVLHDKMKSCGLATLISQTADGLIASHIPLLVDPNPAPYGTLFGHIARANPQAADAAGEALAIFAGPDSYITPSWYVTKQQTGKVVPTWNYVAVHAYGPIEFIDDPKQTLEYVTKLTDFYESGRTEQWAVTDAPEDFIASMVRQIIGLRMPIRRLEGKWKLGQNRPLDDRIGVAHGLEQEAKSELAAITRP